MSHPSKRFIELILAEHWKAPDPLSLAAVNAKLQALHLLPISESAFQEITVAFEPPPNVDFADFNHEATKTFMRRKRLLPGWVADKNYSAVASELLPRIHMRHRLDLLMLGGVPDEEAAFHATTWASALQEARAPASFTRDHVDYYRHFYFSQESLDAAGWHELLRGHPFEEPMLAALHGGPEAARYWAGLRMKLPDGSAALRDVLRAAHFRLKALHHQPTTRAVVDQIVKLGQLVDHLHERLYGSADDSLEQEAKRIKRYFEQTYPVREKQMTLADIEAAGGTYSRDGRSSSELSDGEDLKPAAT